MINTKNNLLIRSMNPYNVGLCFFNFIKGKIIKNHKFFQGSLVTK